MGMQINTNVSALNTYRNLTSTQNSLSKSLEKLSSGLRINRASDDAAGLTIAEGLKSQIGGLNVAARNAQDGISVVQTAEGALSESQSILQRLRDLAVQAGNDSNSDKARTAIQTEATSLVEELGRIAKSTNFNGINLLDGTSASLTFQIGAGSDASSQVSVGLTDLSAVADTLKTGGASFAVANAAAVDGDWTFTAGDSEVVVDMGSAGDYTSVNQVADKLNKTAEFGANFTATVDGNNLVVTSKAGVAFDLTAAPGTGAAVGTNTPADLEFSSAAKAQASIGKIDAAIENISEQRSKLGAMQNRFESAVNTINVSIENLSASKSRLTDVDMAAEMVNFTRANILSQSGTAMLSQANQMPQLALQLLG
jgi:flagellin